MMRMLCTATVLALLNLILCEATGKEEIVPMPSGRRSLFGPHEFCGPYKFHYTKAQDCKVVGSYFHKDHALPHKLRIELHVCEEFCKQTFRCNAINYSLKEDLGCVLRVCGYSQSHSPPDPFPMPIGFNSDWFSFSKYQPDEIPGCHKKVVGTYDTPNNYCGPYKKIWHRNQCPEIGGRIDNVQLLECESKCDDHVRCTGIHYHVARNRCWLIACTGSVEPKPMLTPFFTTLISYSKDRLPDFPRCKLDDRTIRF